MKSLIAKYLVKPFKSFPYFGRFRFWCLYWAYRITGWHIRHKEWDFVLDYLPPLAKWQKVNVMDVGCSRNLLCHEIVGRGYTLFGVDLEKPEFKYPGFFWHGDIKEIGVSCHNTYDFITCISVLEHIEVDKEKALMNMVNCLKIGGRLLLTIPTKEFAQGHPWNGFSIQYFLSFKDVGTIVEYTERAGQMCLCIARKV